MKEKNLPVRKTTRLKNYNYNWMSSYFITICTKEHKCILGEISKAYIENDGGSIEKKIAVSACVNLTEIGKIVEKFIESSKSAYEDIIVENYVIMPNHIHLLLYVAHNEKETTKTSAAIPNYVSALKYHINKECGENIFQRSYHDHIVRGEKDYDKIWDYIDGNPITWKEDCFYK